MRVCTTALYGSFLQEILPWRSAPTFSSSWPTSSRPRCSRLTGIHRCKRPHLDRLAEDGIVFENAYCNFPLCAPSRFSMLSGRLPSRIGAFDNAAELPASVPTFHHYLRAAGYRTCLAGKMHFVGPDQLHGYEERVTTDIYPANFQWVPDMQLDGEVWLEWYHSMRAVLDAGPHRRSRQRRLRRRNRVRGGALAARTRGQRRQAAFCAHRLVLLAARSLSPAAPLVGQIPRCRDRSAAGRRYPARRPRPAQPAALVPDRPAPRRSRRSGGPSYAPRLLCRDELRRCQSRPAARYAQGDRRSGRYRGRFHLRPRRFAGRARPVLQDVVFRTIGAGAAHPACAVRLRAAPGGGERLPSRSFPDAARIGGRRRPAGPRRTDRRPFARAACRRRRNGLARISSARNTPPRAHANRWRWSARGRTS